MTMVEERQARAEKDPSTKPLVVDLAEVGVGDVPLVGGEERLAR